MVEPNHSHQSKRARLDETKDSKDPNEPVVVFVALVLFLTETNTNKENENAMSAAQCYVFNLAQIKPWANANSHFAQLSNELEKTTNPTGKPNTNTNNTLNLVKYVFNKQFGKGPSEALLFTDCIELVLKSNGGIISVQKQNGSKEAFVTVCRFNISGQHVHIFLTCHHPTLSFMLKLTKQANSSTILTKHTMLSTNVTCGSETQIATFTIGNTT